MTKIIIVLFISLSFYGFSQPGGGGGLSINNFYNENLELINLRDSGEILIRTFYSGDHHIETFAYESELKTQADYESTTICSSSFYT